MKTAEQMVAEARTRIREIDVADLRAMDPDDVVIVDIRDVRERAKGRIPGSVHAPRGMLEFWWDPESPYHRDVFAQSGKTYVLHCAMGWRSALAADTLTGMGFDVAHLDGGLDAWKEAGGEIEMPER
ncbi:rhodanese-like domain-containing protein [Jannaschia aquimarina]|uniref:GlpE protein n=1 Tax=Jannaschia aquimarina TaxID=935700 RepID=A0A0D1EF57_9RHOB|nr:rhodanese-like domain-containing protein [Jannaschia aquimarina]KIT15521.1 Thiosulfate sulfurtransferase GlpE [Jannaschia aquimarina]SNT34469.1 Rhodanese-related sulfurtransferase [Jannaschia aquimarina]